MDNKPDSEEINGFKVIRRLHIISVPTIFLVISEEKHTVKIIIDVKEIVVINSKKNSGFAGRIVGN